MKGGHPCPEYTSQIKGEEKKKIQQYKETLDELAGRPKSREIIIGEELDGKGEGDKLSRKVKTAIVGILVSVVIIGFLLLLPGL